MNCLKLMEYQYCDVHCKDASFVAQALRSESWFRINEWPYSHHHLCCTRKCASTLATQNPVKISAQTQEEPFHANCVSIYICLTQVITFNKLSSTPNTVMRTFCQISVCLCKNRQGRVSLCLVFAGWRSAGRLVIIIDINIKSLHLQKLPDSPTPRPWHCVNCSAK